MPDSQTRPLTRPLPDAAAPGKDALIAPADRRRALFGSAVGSTIEWYDYFLQGLFTLCKGSRSASQPAHQGA